MFHTIDLENWERKEIFQRFAGYTYNLTSEVDVTGFLEGIHGKGYKFYPSVCWCIANTVNSDADFRFAKVDGSIGYYERLNPCFGMKAFVKVFCQLLLAVSFCFDTFF